MSRIAAVSLVIVGGGPAGLAPLFAAASEGVLDEVLAGGVVILEAGCRLGPGAFRDYAIRSDSAAEAFLDIILKTKDSRLQRLHDHPAVLAVADHMGRAVPLSLVADFLEVAADVVREILAESPGCAVLTSSRALWTKQVCSDQWRTCFRDGLTGLEHVIESCTVVLATGGHQLTETLLDDSIRSLQALSSRSNKLLQSGSVLAHGGVEHVADRLRGVERPKVVVLGGSASAGAVAVALLRDLPQTLLRSISIVVLHRHPIRLFCESVTAAALDGYTDFIPDDVCALTGRIHRFAGLRLESRELFLSALNIAGRSSPRGLALCNLQHTSTLALDDALERADLIITAVGYVPRLLPVFDHLDRPIALKSTFRERDSAVDQQCQLLDHTGLGLEGLLAIGLAVGPPPLQNMGGEKGFRGQVNSLWLWQHTLGLRIAAKVLERRAFAARDSRVPAPPYLNTDHFRTLVEDARGIA